MSVWNMPPGCSTNDPYFQDGPCVDVLRESSPVARKEHQCWLCGQMISIGTKYRRIVFIDHDNGSKFISSCARHIYCDS